jgi:ABC-type phosphate transport system substrate-binding protein
VTDHSLSEPPSPTLRGLAAAAWVLVVVGGLALLRSNEPEALLPDFDTPTAESNTGPTADSNNAATVGADAESVVEPGADATIVVFGADSLEAATLEVGRDFTRLRPDVQVDVTGPALEPGPNLFCQGLTDLTYTAGDGFPEDDAAACDTNGIDAQELLLGHEALVVATAAGDGIDCVRLSDLEVVLGPEAVGFGRDPDEAGPEAFQSLADSPGALNWFRYGALLNLAGFSDADGIDGFGGMQELDGLAGLEGIKVLDVAATADDPCVTPTVDTIRSGRYPLARELRLHVDPERAATNPALSDFVDHYLGYGIDTALPAAGHLPADEQTRAATIERWLQSTS